MLTRLITAVLVTAGATTLLQGTADAASFRAAPPLRPTGRNLLSCLLSSADGSVVSWRDRQRTIRAGTLQNAPQAQTLGSADYCPVAGVSPDGSAALATETTGPDNHAGLQLALRSAGAAGQFSSFAAVALPADVFPRGPGLGLGAGIVAIGASRQDGDRRVPLLLVRAADGTVRSVSLPGGAGGARTSEDLAGPLAGVDASGRGLVIWGAARAVDGQLLGAPFDGSGTLGAVQVLAGKGVDDTVIDEPSLAVGPDGAAALAWVGGHRTNVLTGTTAGGFDLSTATSASPRWVASVEPDGAAVAVDMSSNGVRGRVRIATRAPGKPFSGVRSYRAGDVGDETPAVAVAHGRYLATFAAEPIAGSSELGLLKAVTGRAGDRPGRALTVPVSSATVNGVTATVPPDGPAAVLTITKRSMECVTCKHLHESFGIDAFRFSSRPPRRPRGVRIRLERHQSLGHPQAVRVHVACPRRCAVRVAGSVAGEGGTFDTSRALRPGRTVLRVPYSSGGGSTPIRPLPRARRLRLGIAVDDATGELRVQRRLVVRP